MEAEMPELESEVETEDDEEATGLDFHDLLKAKGMKLRRPMQVIRPATYDETQRRKQVRRKDKVKSNQDEATRAWNFHTALYYKAGGTPWRMIRDEKDWETCYVGVSFYKTRDGSRLMTSVAQVFNQRGEGVVMRGGKAQLSKDDKNPFLAREDAFKLLIEALKMYKQTHGHSPARVVLHKTSTFQPEEEEGFNQAVESKEIERLDLVHVSKSYTRLLRAGVYPPRRGTVFVEEENTQVLYTKGSVEFYSTYPGQYLPVPLRLRYMQKSQSSKFLTQEILALTKMNWNNTQFDGADPITIRAARQVSDILKYIDDGDLIEPLYRYYM
jgi:argonaute-like protein implicated in RNA metabolism and viral defense